MSPMSPGSLRGNRYADSIENQLSNRREDDSRLSACIIHLNESLSKGKSAAVQIYPVPRKIGPCCVATTLAREHSATADQTCSRACRGRQDWLAHVSAFLLEPAASSGCRHQSPTGTAPPLHHPKHDECLYAAIPEGKPAVNSVVVRSVLPFETCGRPLVPNAVANGSQWVPGGW